MSTYNGLQVLDFVEPDGATEIIETLIQRNATLGSSMGKDVVEATWLAPAPTRSIALRFQSRSEVALFRQFIDAIKGPLSPFWYPSYVRELSPYAAASAGAGSFNVEYVNYTGLLHDNGIPGRRHVALIRRGVANEYHFVTTSAAHFGLWETLTLDSNLSNAVVLGSTACFILKLYRMDVDLARIEWRGNSWASCDLPVREVPLEEPQS